MMHGKYKMETTILTSSINASFHLRSPDRTLYTIEISKVPKCDCPYSSVKKGIVCKHRIFILVEKCGVNLNSKLLCQTSFTNEEVRALIRAARESRPTASSSTPNNLTTRKSFKSSSTSVDPDTISKTGRRSSLLLGMQEENVLDWRGPHCC